MKNFTKLFVLIVALFSVSTLSAQVIKPNVDLDINDLLNGGVNAELQVNVDQGSTAIVPISINDALGLIIGLVSDVSVTVDGSPNFQVTDIKKGILGLNLVSFKVRCTANIPSGSEETATIKINIKTPLRTNTLAAVKIKMMSI
jgi:hypothetical protein